MPGYTPTAAQTKREPFPPDTWLKLSAGVTHLVDFHTVLIPEGGQWVHDIVLPGNKYPTAVPCVGKDAGCPVCSYNASMEKADRYKSGLRHFCIASVLGEFREGAFTKYPAPKTGLVEKRSGFWDALALAEQRAAHPDELEDAEALEQDWRKWHVKVTISESRPITYTLEPRKPTDRLPLYPLSEGVLARYMALAERLMTPWDNVDGLLKRVREHQDEPTAPRSTDLSTSPTVKPLISDSKHWSQVDESLQTFWKTMRAMGVQPVKVLEYLGVKDLLHYPDSMEDAVAQVTAKLF